MRIWKWTMVVVVPAVLVMAAQSQERTLPEGETIKLLLLRQKSVQKELGISPKVTEKVMAFTHKQHEIAEKALTKVPAERKEAFEKLHQENRKFLADTLSAKQNKRLDQIALQFTALRQLTKPETAAKLKLTEEQQQKFKTLHEEARKKFVDLIHSKKAAGRSEKLAELHEKTRASIMAVLTDKQKEQVRELAGPPFKGKIEIEEPK